MSWLKQQQERKEQENRIRMAENQKQIDRSAKFDNQAAQRAEAFARAYLTGLVGSVCRIHRINEEQESLPPEDAVRLFAFTRQENRISLFAGNKLIANLYFQWKDYYPHTDCDGYPDGESEYMEYTTMELLLPWKRNGVLSSPSNGHAVHIDLLGEYLLNFITP